MITRFSKRKGTGIKPAPNHTHSYLNRIENACLILFTAFLGLFIGGYAIKSEPMTYLGLGLGIAVLVIQTIINTKED